MPVTLEARHGTTLDDLERGLAALRTGQRTTVTGDDPDEEYPVPSVFTEFAEAPDLHAIVGALIDRHPRRFGFLRDLRVVTLWKAKGGASGGKEVWGKTQKPTGLLGHFSAAHYVIWLAADHVSDRALTRWQVEALLFHELLHTGLREGKPVITPHEFEGFTTEIAEYGFWKSDLEAVCNAVQGRLPFEPDGDGAV